MPSNLSSSLKILIERFSLFISPIYCVGFLNPKRFIESSLTSSVAVPVNADITGLLGNKSTKGFIYL